MNQVIMLGHPSARTTALLIAMAPAAVIVIDPEPSQREPLTMEDLFFLRTQQIVETKILQEEFNYWQNLVQMEMTREVPEPPTLAMCPKVIPLPVMSQHRRPIQRRTLNREPRNPKGR